MSYKESDIMFEAGSFWVLKDTNKKAYHVMKTGVTHSTSIASFELNDDGFTLAEAYFNYQVNREERLKQAK